MQIDEIDTMDQGMEDIATWEGIIRDLEGKLADKREHLNKITNEMKTNNELYRKHEKLLEDHDDKVREVSKKLQETRVKIKVCTNTHVSPSHMYSELPLLLPSEM